MIFLVFQVVGLVVLVLQPLNIIKKLAFPSFEQELDPRHKLPRTEVRKKWCS